jgi:hypothetical protein
MKLSDSDYLLAAHVSGLHAVVKLFETGSHIQLLSYRSKMRRT